MSSPDETNDQRAIDDLVAAFFGLFSNRGGVTPNLHAVFDLCIPEAVICKPPDVMSLHSFIAPRQELLTDGTLVDFEEVETESRTSILGTIAQRACSYMKSGSLHGVAFQTRGAKVFQFIKTADGWRISAVAWDDERG
jgi:hypothetical protein